MANPELFFIESLQPLYEDVQRAALFADSKFFVDAVPRFAAAEILGRYQSQKELPSFSLQQFVATHFVLPQESSTSYSSAQKNIETHLHDLWKELTRQPGASGGTLIPLPHAYIVPGGRFREIYYWDSYFTMLGLQVSGRIDLVESMINNFSFLINEFGFIPNGNRTYYLSRSQPPFFALMLHLLSEERGAAVLSKYKPALQKEYDFWMQGSDALSAAQPAIKEVVLLEDGAVLNRYYDTKDTPRPEAFSEDEELTLGRSNAPDICRNIRSAAASGWDFSSRWFADKATMQSIQTTSLIPVDLNCLLLFMEKLLQKMYALENDTASADLFAEKIQRRKKALHHYCWNETEGYFFDYNFISGKQEIHFSLAAVFPLFFNLATNEQAEKVAAHIEQQFLFAGGLVTTIYNTGQQWDAPNGWAPLQWLACCGLSNYRFTELATEIKSRWLAHCEKVYNETGKLMEKYNVVDTAIAAGGGEYPNQDGFGWTNGVYLKMKDIE